MLRCFVAQPFDEGGPFDRRFDEVIKPAIEKAGFDAYRVDRDRSCANLIEGIKDGISKSKFFFADISEDNPNVWFELGIADAIKKKVVLICSDDRKKFPFDVSVLKIIKYKKESPSSFSKLSTEITDTIQELARKEESLGSSASEPLQIMKDLDGLNQREASVLGVIFGNIDCLDDSMVTRDIKEEME